MKFLPSLFILTLVGFLLSACSTPVPESRNDHPDVQKHVPGDWSQEAEAGYMAEDWLDDFGDANLVRLVEMAFERNAL